MFPTLGSFLFWRILPYLIATFAFVAHKRLGAAENPRKESLRMGKELAEKTRGIMKPVTTTKGSEVNVPTITPENRTRLKKVATTVAKYATVTAVASAVAVAVTTGAVKTPLNGKSS